MEWHSTACRDHLDAGSGGPDMLWNFIPTLFHCCFWAAILRADSESVRQTLVPLLFPAHQKWQPASRRQSCWARNSSGTSDFRACIVGARRTLSGILLLAHWKTPFGALSPWNGIPESTLIILECHSKEHSRRLCSPGLTFQRVALSS